MAAITTSLLLALLAATRSNALHQTYCSTENTGEDYTPLNSIYMSNGKCFTNCQANYAFAVVQYQNCWCSNYIPAEQASLSDCNVNCPGYPAEQCGNLAEGYYGYVALSLSPSGTAGSSSSPTTSSSTEDSTTSAPPQTTPSTISTQSPTTEPSSTVVPPSPSPSSSSTTLSSSSTSPPSSSVSKVTSSTDSSQPTISSAPDSSSSPQTTSSATPTTNTRVVTISGAVVTQTVTSTPDTTGSGSSSNASGQQEHSNNTGAIVGGVIGGLALLALIACAIFFFLRRRRQNDDPSEKMSRNASVLSKSGLIGAGSARTRDAEKFSDEQSYGGQRQAGSEVDGVSSPAATHSASGSLGRSSSRPLVYDQRLNPAALLGNWQLNGSQTSLNTIQDQRDYSRPLGVTNPDPEEE